VREGVQACHTLDNYSPPQLRGSPALSAPQLPAKLRNFKTHASGWWRGPRGRAAGGARLARVAPSRYASQVIALFRPEGK